MTSVPPSFYDAPDTYLQQGDVFETRIVTPYADRTERLFRAADGRHGSVVFAEDRPGMVFATADLEVTLQSLTSLSALHTQPFCSTPDGQKELVVVFGDVAEYFVVITQTCDVSGHDKSRLPFAMILPARTIMAICRGDRIPFDDGDPKTIEEFLCSTASGTLLRSVTEPLRYFELLREVIDAWKPSTNSETTTRNRIKKFINKNFDGAKHVFHLPRDAALSIPDLFVEFSGAYTVDVILLDQLKDFRIARIAVPYREEFAKAFADRIARIAVPALPPTERIK